MKRYVCPQCNSQSNLPLEDCPSCGATISISDWSVIDIDEPKPETPSQLVLIGDKGELVIRRSIYPQDVGRPLISKVSSEFNYAGQVQFTLTWRDSSCFIAPPQRETSNILILDDAPLDSEKEIKHGSKIALKSKSSNRTAMLLMSEYRA
jgi:hypothetical protein